MSARWNTCVSHTYTHMYTRRITSIRDSWGGRGGSGRLVHVLVEERSGEKNGENKVVQDRGSIADIRLSQRGRRDIWKCSPGAVERDGRKKGHSRGIEECERKGEGGELFILRSGAKMYDIVPDKVARFYFRLPLLSSSSLPPRIPLTPFSLSRFFFLCHVFFSLFFACTPFSLCVFHEQHKFPPEKSTVQWHASTRTRLFFSIPTFFHF